MPGRSAPGERDLPRAAGHLELEAGLDEEGDTVLDVAEDLQPEALALALRLGAGPQPEEAGLVAPRPGHALAVEAQVHEADLRGDAQRLGQSRPGEAAGDAVAAGPGAGGACPRDRRRGRGSRRGGRPAASARRRPGGARRPRGRPAGRGRRCRRSARGRASAGRARGRRPVPGPSRSRGSAPGPAPTGPTAAGPAAGRRARWAGRSRSKSAAARAAARISQRTTDGTRRRRTGTSLGLSLPARSGYR